jgi:hypothetical protein
MSLRRAVAVALLIPFAFFSYFLAMALVWGK